MLEWSERIAADNTRKREMVYIAGPYTKPLDGKNIRSERYEQLTKAAAEFMHDGYLVYSPITHTHPLDQLLAAQTKTDTLGSDYWVNLDTHFMHICDRCVVIKLPGWEESSGVKREIEHFEFLGKPVDYIEPSEYALGNTKVMKKNLLGKAQTAPTSHLPLAQGL